jgi:hypothetical protein
MDGDDIEGWLIDARTPSGSTVVPGPTRDASGTYITTLLTGGNKWGGLYWPCVLNMRIWCKPLDTSSTPAVYETHPLPIPDVWAKITAIGAGDSLGDQIYVKLGRSGGLSSQFRVIPSIVFPGGGRPSFPVAAVDDVILIGPCNGVPNAPSSTEAWIDRTPRIPLHGTWSGTDTFYPIQLESGGTRAGVEVP